ncbi:MAG TPA: DNA-binding protein [Firmicutes bacterium]|jgi:HEPN domain-containing protein|nr:DNA-binding protein [Bacillota bacterium]
MKNLDIANEWFKMAELDFNSAKFLLMNMRPAPLEIICYHCEQCAEKYLKGFIALNGGQIIKTHDLVILNKNCLMYSAKCQEIENDCIELTDYGVPMRYPFHLEIEETDVTKAIESTEKIIKLIKEESVRLDK